ncbi:hypothetical protein SSX86_030211 [Deinandra increscens subsp. villosa]|uniref:DUSP domain-containing protein n=1 Tax=Deinandra increscens subsp. villosa TaxID=3103831 RepID=A0AAP0GJV9_9ASTR
MGVQNHGTNTSTYLFIRLVGGGLAGITAASVTYPLDLRNEMYYSGVWHALTTINREEGVFGLYIGRGTPLLLAFQFMIQGLTGSCICRPQIQLSLSSYANGWSPDLRRAVVRCYSVLFQWILQSTTHNTMAAKAAATPATEIAAWTSALCNICRADDSNHSYAIALVKGLRFDLQLPRTLIERSDYVLVPQFVWEKLHGWYKGGPALPRQMISLGIQKTLSVEVYPLALKVHLWDYFNDQKQTVLACSDQTLEESDLQMDQSILFDVQADGFIPFGSGMDSTGNQLALILFGSALEAAGSGPGDIASAWSTLEAAGSGPGDITSAWSALEAAGSGPGDITSAWSAIKAARSGV